MSTNIPFRKIQSSHCRLLVLASAMVLIAACGGADSTSPPPGGNADVWNVVAQRNWTLGADNEGYFCHAQLVTSDEYITGFRIASPSAAQTEVYLLVSDLPSTSGDFDCSFGSLLGSELIYAAGPGSDSIKFIGGKGVHVGTGHYLMLMVHVDNTSSAAMTSATKIEARAGTAASVTTPADMVLAGTASIEISSDGQNHDMSGGCTISGNSHILAILPLMRGLGRHQKVEITDGASTQTILDAAFDPTHVRFANLSTDASWPGGSMLKVTCSYVNNSGSVVHFGDAQDSELCFSAIYRYPPVAATSTAPFDCVSGIFDRTIDVGSPRANAIAGKSEHRSS